MSIIIPVYNRQTLVKRCLDSCIGQTMPHEDYEIIVVDDCSTDNTIRVCQDYAEANPDLVRVFQLEKNSGGASKPRNVGMDNARGEYVFFVDSDDTIIPETLADGYYMAKNGDCDLVIVRASASASYAFDKNRELDAPALSRADWTRGFGTMNDFFKLSRIRQLGLRVCEGLMGREDTIFLLGFMFQLYDIRWNVLGKKLYYVADVSRTSDDVGVRSPWHSVLQEYDLVKKTFAHILRDPRLADKDELALKLFTLRRSFPALLRMDERKLNRCSNAFHELVPVETDKYLSPRVAHVVKAIRDNDLDMYRKHVAYEIMVEERLALADYLEKRELPPYKKRARKRDVLLFGWHYTNDVGESLSFYALHKLLDSAGLSILVAQHGIKENQLPRGKRINYDLTRDHYALTKYRMDRDWHQGRSLADIFVTAGKRFWCKNENWRPDIWQLGCGDNTVKKIAVNVSFGDAKYAYSTKNRPVASYLFRKFNHISVRGQDDVDILAGLGVENTDRILDPVFLLHPDAYSALREKAAHVPEENFVFAYYQNISKENYDLLVSAKEKLTYDGDAFAMSTPGQKIDEHWTSCDSGAEFWTDATSADFLCAISKAAFIITDDFHCACFAIMSRTPFLLIRNNAPKAERLTFFEQLGLGDRLVDSKKVSTEAFTARIDWDAVDEKLGALRTKSFAWFETAFGRKFYLNP